MRHNSQSPKGIYNWNILREKLFDIYIYILYTFNKYIFGEKGQDLISSEAPCKESDLLNTATYDSQKLWVSRSTSSVVKIDFFHVIKKLASWHDVSATFSSWAQWKAVWSQPNIEDNNDGKQKEHLRELRSDVSRENK